MHTVNGGKSFHQISAPPTDFPAGNVSILGRPLVSDIRFADLSNGWVFGTPLATAIRAAPRGTRSRSAAAC